MDKLNKASLKNIDDAVLLDHKTLYRIGDDLIDSRYVGHVARVLDSLDGSRVGLYLVPYDDKSGVFLQLRCGEIICTESFLPRYLDGLISLAPFIAACAGEAEPEPSELEAVKRRLSRLEQLAGIEPES